ncbi:MAG: hypothetical protein WDK96_02435 [Candidatus Paceibacterota bacterium]|jgi:hypothetical protein
MRKIGVPVVGFSLALCIRDILDGKYYEKNVVKIVAETNALKKQHWDEILACHKKGCWKDNPKKAEEIFNRLLEAKKIEQPRLDGKAHKGIKNGHWERYIIPKEVEKEIEVSPISN